MNEIKALTPICLNSPIGHQRKLMSELVHSLHIKVGELYYCFSIVDIASQEIEDIEYMTKLVTQNICSVFCTQSGCDLIFSHQVESVNSIVARLNQLIEQCNSQIIVHQRMSSSVILH